MGRRSAGMLLTILGVMKAGGAYVPLDPKDPEERLLGMIRDAGVKLLAIDGVSAELGSRLAKVSGCKVFSWEELNIPGAASPQDWMVYSAEEPRRSRPIGKDLAYIFYTSGSTGVPKGAMVERRGVLNHLRSKLETLTLGSGDVVVQNASHCFDISVWQFLAALMVGGRVVIYGDDLVLNPTAFLEAVKRDNVTILEVVPSYLELLLGADAVNKLARLRYLVSTAETLSVSLSRRWLERFPLIPLVNAWGPTECSDDITHQILHAGFDGKERVGIGRPIKGAYVFILGPDFSLAPVGCTGEIAVAGVCVGRGYVGDPVKTARTFVPNPFSGDPGSRLYLTGDIGRWTWDGLVEFLGRRDGQVKVRGRRIEIAEIEGALSSHSGVNRAVTAVHDGRLVAYWTGDAALEMRTLKKHLSDRLPQHMVPEAFVRLDDFPLTRTGKVDRRALPLPDWSQSAQEYVAPRTFMEGQIAEAWQEVLGIAKIGVHDNFFEIGGHSLSATRIVLKLQALAGPEVSIRHLFLNPTIAGLASVLGASKSSELTVENIPGVGEKPFYPLAPTQRPMWLAFNDVLRMEVPRWGFPQLIRIEGEIDHENFQKALDALVARHESLRISFAEVGGEPGIVVHQEVKVVWQFQDLSALSNENQKQELGAILAQQLVAPLRNAPPMLRVQLIRLAAANHYIVMQVPHITSDVWTEHILVEDLAEIYSSIQEKRSCALPELPVRYVDYAEWHQKKLASPLLQAQKEYWLSQFSGNFEPLRLEQVSAGAQEPSAGQEIVFLPNELMTRLKGVARDRGTTLFVVLVAALQGLLARLTGSTDIVVGSAANGRTHPLLDRVAGFFMNPLCLRSDLSGDPTFAEQLGRVHQTILTAMAHQDYPFQQWLHALRRKIGRSDFYPYSMVLLLEEQPRDLRFAGAKAFFESLPSAGFDSRRVAGPTLSLRISEAPNDWYVEMIRGTMDKSSPPANLLGWWTGLLREIAADPEKRLGEFNLLSPEEEHALSALGRTDSVDSRLVELIRVFQRSRSNMMAALPDNTTADLSGKETDLLGSARSGSLWCDATCIVVTAATLRSLVTTGRSISQQLPALQRVIVEARSPRDLEFFAGRVPHLSAFVALDESEEPLLWIDHFQPGSPLAGRPLSQDLLCVLDEWEKPCPIGIKGKLYKKLTLDPAHADWAPLPWSGMWRSDGLLEITARQFDTIELDADELEEILH
jgi:amino acid adenylation domain-containing protein